MQAWERQQQHRQRGKPTSFIHRHKSHYDPYYAYYNDGGNEGEGRQSGVIISGDDEDEGVSAAGSPFFVPIFFFFYFLLLCLLALSHSFFLSFFLSFLHSSFLPSFLPSFLRCFLLHDASYRRTSDIFLLQTAGILVKICWLAGTRSDETFNL